MLHCKICSVGEVITHVHGILGADVIVEGSSVLSVEKELFSTDNLPIEPNYFKIVVLERCDYCGNEKVLNEQIKQR